MEKISAIIVDDEQKSVDLLVHFIGQYCPEIAVIGSATTKRTALKLIRAKQPNLLFLDIELDEGTGFDLLKELEVRDTKVIFVTSFNEYAIQAFKYNAIDYILKPIQIEELIIAVKKAEADIQKDQFTNTEQMKHLFHAVANENQKFEFIAVPTIDRVDFVKVDSIVYLESDGRYTKVHFNMGNCIVASKILGEFEVLLDSNKFFRIHRSYLINLSNVISIYKTDGYYCELDTGEKLPVAKRRIDFLLKFLNL
jgi:two-component system LytT family response regulator